mgnify:FL=1
MKERIFVTYALRSLAITVFTLAATFSLPLRAHLMVAQHGTLNLVDNGVYIVLSVPVSSLTGIKNNADGTMSKQEFIRNKADIISTFKRQVTLSDETGNRPLQGVMISPANDHHDDEANIAQIILMGRYLLADDNENLIFDIGLYGKSAHERQYQLSFTNKAMRKKMTFSLSPGKRVAQLF